MEVNVPGVVDELEVETLVEEDWLFKEANNASISEFPTVKTQVKASSLLFSPTLIFSRLLF